MSDKASQKGMTLVEVLVACAITVIIVGGLSTAIYMIISATERGNGETSALHDVQNAAYWISYDAQMASTTDLVEGDQLVDSLSLDWTDCYGNSHSSSYWLSDSKLQRDYDDTTTTVAWYVSSIEFSISGDVLTFHLESTPEGRWDVGRETTGNVCLRPNT